jgi:hypothetical protein
LRADPCCESVSRAFCKATCRTYVPSDPLSSLGEQMFWSHENQEPAESIGRDTREELRLRLRAAADFATLGAYELLEPDEAPHERAAPAPPPKRVLLFAKVAPVCPHSAAIEPGCAKRPGSGPRLSRTRTSTQRHTQRQRGGSVHAPEQPCLCAGEHVPST